MMSVALNRYDVWRYADCRYAERRGANFGISLTIIYGKICFTFL
jgi:hypothetical protein